MLIKSPLNKLILMILFLMGVICLLAFDYVIYSESDGLANNSVRQIAVAPDSSLWIACADEVFMSGGLSHWDRNVWTNYYTWNTDGAMVSNLVQGCVLDEVGILWIISGNYFTESAIVNFDGLSWETYHSTCFFSDCILLDFRSIAIDSANTIWVTTNQGLISFDDSSFTEYDTSTGFDYSPDFLRLELDYVLTCSDTCLWISSTHFGVYCLKDTILTQYTVEDGLLSNNIYKMASDNGGKIWIAGDSGISVFDGLEWANPFVGISRLDEFTEFVVVDALNRKWFCKDNILYCYNDTAYHLIEIEEAYIIRVLGFISPNEIYCDVEPGGFIVGDINTIEWDWIPIDNIEENETHLIAESSIFPNPFNSSCRILAESDKSNISIIDINGKTIETFEGKNAIWQPANSTPSGIYFVNIQNENEAIIEKVVYLK